MARANEKESLERVKDALLGKNNIRVYAACELTKITECLFSAKANPDGNAFPDFVFDGGGIEHFELTSSRETKKGSAFRLEEKRNQQKRLCARHHPGKFLRLKAAKKNNIVGMAHVFEFVVDGRHGPHALANHNHPVS